jgi:hypothetical protein
MKTLTLDEIIGFAPCEEYTKNDNALLLQLANGRTECTLIELLEREDIPPKDRVWLATRDGVLTREQATRFATTVARRAVQNHALHCLM